jgi:hypothetical protein
MMLKQVQHDSLENLKESVRALIPFGSITCIRLLGFYLSPGMLIPIYRDSMTTNTPISFSSKMGKNAKKQHFCEDNFIPIVYRVSKK